MLKREIQHNTPEQVAAYLSAALALVDEIGPPDDLAQVFFVKACDLLAAKQLFFEQPAPLGAGLMQIPRGNGQ